MKSFCKNVKSIFINQYNQSIFVAAMVIRMKNYYYTILVVNALLNHKSLTGHFYCLFSF